MTTLLATDCPENNHRALMAIDRHVI